MGLTYLASPYSMGGADAHERERRFRAVCRVAAALMVQGENIFCPIAHSHPVERFGMTTIEGHDFWLKQDFAVLKHCDKMKILLMKGLEDWTKSTGISREHALAMHIGIPISFITEAEAFAGVPNVGA